MRVAVCITLVLLVGLVVAVSAQPTVGYEGQLLKLTSALNGPINNVGKPCGPYFLFTGPKGFGKVGMLIFVASSTGKDGAKEISIPMLGTDKFQIRLVSRLKIPRIKVLRSGGPVFPWIEIAISPTDLKQAPCLSHVSMVGSISAN